MKDIKVIPIFGDWKSKRICLERLTKALEKDVPIVIAAPEHCCFWGSTEGWDERSNILDFLIKSKTEYFITSDCGKFLGKEDERVINYPSAPQIQTKLVLAEDEKEIYNLLRFETSLKNLHANDPNINKLEKAFKKYLGEK